MRNNYTSIIFDVGGVLHESGPPAWIAVAEYVEMPYDLVKQAYNQFIDSFITGKVNERQFYENLFEFIGTKKDLPETSLFLKGWDKVRAFQENVELVEKLKRDGYKVAILSNTVPPHAKWNRSHGVYKPFEISILSYEVGLKKPRKEIYEKALEKLKAKPQEVIFVDDISENIESADLLGIKGILYQDPIQLKRSFKNLGINI